MDPKRIVALVVGASVMVLIFSALLVPIINDATTTEKTLTNDGLFRLTKYDADAEITATWDYTKPNQITVNETDVALPLSAAYLMSISGNDGFFLRYGALTSGQYGIQLYDSTSTLLRLQASTTGSSSMTIAISNGTASFTVGDTTIDETINDSFFFVDSNGSFVMKKATDTAYVKSDSEFYGIGRTTINTSGAQTVDNLYINGTIDDGITVSSMTGMNATYSDGAITSTSVSGYVDTYALSGFTFVITYDSATTNASYTQIIVPYEVTAELSVHPDSATNALLSAIPIIAMIGIVLAVVGVAIVGRNDY